MNIVSQYPLVNMKLISRQRLPSTSIQTVLKNAFRRDYLKYFDKLNYLQFSSSKLDALHDAKSVAALMAGLALCNFLKVPLKSLYLVICDTFNEKSDFKLSAIICLTSEAAFYDCVKYLENMFTDCPSVNDCPDPEIISSTGTLSINFTTPKSECSSVIRQFVSDLYNSCGYHSLDDIQQEVEDQYRVLLSFEKIRSILKMKTSLS